MAHYKSVKPWCELILHEQMPMTMSGEWHGLSVLYPMEKLFERYVADCLRKKLGNTATVVAQVARQHLCRHDGSPWFELRPDLLIVRGSQNWVLDTKWKRLNENLNTTKDKYGVSQGDMYQMFAYGQRYLDGRGDMVLIYPKTKDFGKPLPVFEFSKELRLWMAAFDMEKGAFVDEGLPDHLRPVIGLAPWADVVN